jgi:hypothetical protein
MHYKFLDSIHVRNVMVDGTIIISSFEYFRPLEESAWGGIADNLEGATEFKLPDEFTATAGSANLAQLNSAGIGLGMCAQFARVETGGKLDLSGARFIHQAPDAFIFSASWGGWTASASTCVRRPQNPIPPASRYEPCID